MSFRLPPEEARAIRNNAERSGMSVSDWIRGVRSAAAERGAPVRAPVPSQRVNMTKARRLVAELDRELNRVVEQAEPTSHGRRNTSSSRRSGTKRSGE
ncbi:MAG: plasmid mobilization protein [Pseudonocardiales bacterium]